MLTPNEDIIPITYASGTGGNFLCHFIVSATRKYNIPLRLSENGNAHLGLKDINGSSLGTAESDINKIEYLLNTPPNPGSVKPYYTLAHISDINLVNTYFKKSIRITYDLSDTEELTYVYFGKWFTDDSKKENVIHNTISSSRLHVHRWLRKFNKLDMPNVLFISWKELYKGDPEELILKISKFTHIDTIKFSVDDLIKWRNATNKCIETFERSEIT
jgi:hypothetical protein